MLAQHSFSSRGVGFRERFDILLPELTVISQPVWKMYPNMVPITRKYLLSFQGQINGEKGLDPTTASLIDSLKQMSKTKTQDRFLFSFDCIVDQQLEVFHGDWGLCGEESQRIESLQASTFALIIAPSSTAFVHARGLRIRLYESLRSGSIPVILGSDTILPFSEYLDWTRFSIQLPRARVSELHYILRTLTFSDLFGLKRQVCHLFPFFKKEFSGLNSGWKKHRFFKKKAQPNVFLGLYSVFCFFFSFFFF